MNIQQKVSQLAMKKKQQDTHADAKSHTYDEIQNALSEDQKRLISKYYQQLTSLGFKKVSLFLFEILLTYHLGGGCLSSLQEIGI